MNEVSKRDEYITKNDMLKSTDNISSEKELSESNTIKKSKKKTIDEICLQNVIEDGSTSWLYDLGPFSENLLIKIIEDSKRKKIPICIVEKKKYEKVNLTKTELDEQIKLSSELQKVYTEISKTNAKSKKKTELLKKKKEIQKKLSRISNFNNKYSYHIYINTSRLKFINQIREDSYPADIQMQKTHVSMIESSCDETIQICDENNILTKSKLSEPGNYGSLAMFYLHGKDYFESHLSVETYYKFRNLENHPMDHIAQKYSGIQPMRILFEPSRLIDYVFYLCQAKKIDEEIFIQYVHADQDLYKSLDFSELPNNVESQISDWEMPLSFVKLKNVILYCDKNNCPVSYRICLPIGDLKNKDGFKKIKVIVRTELNITKFI